MTVPHRLSPLLAPRSVALVGASARPGSVGNRMIHVLRDCGFDGSIWLVNPRYDEIEGLACHGSVAALPEPPDLALLAVGPERLEAALDDAIAGGARAAAIFATLDYPDDAEPRLPERLRAKARAAGMPVLGGNCMGYYNFDARCHASFLPPPDRAPGGITLICHSGSVFVVLADNDTRYRFNLIVSPGQENNASVADYMDYALEQPSTRVIALFIETVRDPAGFIAALEKARARDVPVVALKIGRTEQSARLAATHSGAIAGNDAAYEAVFDRYGVRRARTLDELMATALVLSQPQRPGPGGLAGLTDSGGLRELLIDLAADEGVPFAALSDETTAKLAAALPYGLEPVNPVDGAGPLSGDFIGVFRDCLDILMSDPASAIGLFEFEVRDAFIYIPEFIEMAEAVPERHGKPFLVINSFTGARNDAIAGRLLDSGVAMVNGAETALKAVRHALDYRDFRARAPLAPPAGPGEDVIARWRGRLADGGALGESDSLALLADFGVPVAASTIAGDREAAVAAAAELGCPVVLKTAQAGAGHKTELDGVRLGLADADAVARAYDDLAARLGPAVSIQPMAPAGIEIALGMVNDPQFGPLVMAGAGGVLVEVLGDRRFSLAPFDVTEARRLIDRLKLRPLLDGVRGGPPADIDALATALAAFSVLAHELGEVIAEIDVNPVIAGPHGCLAVDALVVGGVVGGLVGGVVGGVVSTGAA